MGPVHRCEGPFPAPTYLLSIHLLTFNAIYFCRVVAEIDDANRQLARLGMADAAVGGGGEGGMGGAGLERVKRLANSSAVAAGQQQPGMPGQQGGAQRRIIFAYFGTG